MDGGDVQNPAPDQAFLHARVCRQQAHARRLSGAAAMAVAAAARRAEAAIAPDLAAGSYGETTAATAVAETPSCTIIGGDAELQEHAAGAGLRSQPSLPLEEDRASPDTATASVAREAASGVPDVGGAGTPDESLDSLAG
jgi:ubiquitin carboxyl-terminal hydrolase 22/27/51